MLLVSVTTGAWTMSLTSSRSSSGRGLAEWQAATAAMQDHRARNATRFPSMAARRGLNPAHDPTLGPLGHGPAYGRRGRVSDASGVRSRVVAYLAERMKSPSGCRSCAQKIVSPVCCA